MVRSAAGVWLAITALAAPPQAQDLVPASDAGAHIGKTKIVCADVAAVRRDGNDTILELLVAQAPPVLIVVTNRARRVLVPTFETAATGWNVCGRGKIEQKPDGLRVRIDDGFMLRAMARRPAGRAGFAEGVPSALSAGVALPQTVIRPNPKYTANGTKAKMALQTRHAGNGQPIATVVTVVMSFNLH